MIKFLFQLSKLYGKVADPRGWPDLADSHGYWSGLDFEEALKKMSR